jgi:regulator of protease activity HflC (stomatin/prohibitin superfamily)
MPTVTLFFFVVAALASLAASTIVPHRLAKAGLLLLAPLLLIGGLVASSVRFVGADEVGIVTRNAFGSRLSDGRIIAVDGEMGVQAEVLSPGWHFGYWPFVFDVDTTRLVEVKSGEVGLVEARDGEPLDRGQLFAPEVDNAAFKRMVEDAAHFLTDGGGRKGPQSNVLTPGRYRINTALFSVRSVPSIKVPEAAVAVLKANFGEPPTLQVQPAPESDPVSLAGENERGVRAVPLPPGTYPINPEAYTVSIVSNEVRILYFTEGRANRGADEQKEITVRTSDGFTFPVDVRVEYMIEPENAPVVIAKLGDDQEKVVAPLNSSVRAIFRNNAESVKALDYVQQRSLQESQSLAMLQAEMAGRGVTITAVRIGDVGTDDPDLQPLLKTQTDREIALQEQLTFQEQQRAAEQKKMLTRTEQEAEEEKRLATASYEVKIAEQDKQRRLIEAEAEAEAIRIEADGRSEAFRLVANEIGSGNAALVELLKIIGERQIEITPRVMVVGDRGSGEAASGETVALIGTMLDAMVEKAPERTTRGGGKSTAAGDANAP